MKQKIRFFFFAAAFVFLSLFSSKAAAYTAADYYNAGLQLYNAKNYDQARQYFEAAVNLDPTNAAALTGAANCYYALGDDAHALVDYQKLQAMDPNNNQWPALIQQLQAKTASASSAAPGSSAAPSAPAASSDLQQGESFYTQKQFSPAVSSFQKASQENPTDPTAFYYLGLSQVQLGDMRDAAVALSQFNKLRPSQQVADYIAQIMNRLSPDDQQWVNGQMAASTVASSAAVSAPAKPKDFGISLEPAIAMFNLADFQTNAESLKNEATTLQASDPSLSFNASVPEGNLNITVEPALNLGQGLELGLPLSYFPVGTVTDTLQDNSGSSFKDSYDLSAFSVGLSVKYDFGKGDLQPFVLGEAFVEPMNIGYTVTNPGNPPQSQSFSGIAIGGLLKAGVDWHLDDTFVVSAFLGYQATSSATFEGTDASGATGTFELVPTPYGNEIEPVGDNDKSSLPPGSRPLQVDLSGLIGGFQIGAFF
jgi:Flp pilus assembly protein TadD